MSRGWVQDLLGEWRRYSESEGAQEGDSLDGERQQQR